MSDGPGGMRLLAAGASHGGRVRDQNEDAHLLDTDRQIFAVADGMGGHAAGEVASAIAIRRVHEAWVDAGLRQLLEDYSARPLAEERLALFRAVRDGVSNAHFEILEQGQRDEGKHGMGTTFTGFLVAGAEAMFAHAGDSRAYLVSDGVALQLSEDHTILARLRASGMEPLPDDGIDDDRVGAPGAAAPADLRRRRGSRRRWRGVLTSALGVGDLARVATFAVPLCSGDRVLLCTDGIHDYLGGGEAELAELVDGAADPVQAANRLVELALERGGADNATVVVVQVIDAGERGGPGLARGGDGRVMAGCALFSTLSPQERLRASRISTPHELEVDRELALTLLGDRVVHLVLDGEVVLASGERVGPGGLVYPEALIDGTALPRQAAIAVAPCRLLVIRRRDFLELTEEESDLGVKLYAALARLMAR